MLLVGSGCWLSILSARAESMWWGEGKRWVAFDGPLWDISDDGLPFRLSLVQPTGPDPLGRLFRVTDQQWTATIGYAEVHDKASDEGVLRAGGGNSYMIGLGRQWRWALPEWTELRGWRPHMSIELGLNYADGSLPSDGTHFNFPVIPGFEWQQRGDNGAGWSFGVRWFHLSNANLIEGNAGYDGFVFRIGRRVEW